MPIYKMLVSIFLLFCVQQGHAQQDSVSSPTEVKNVFYINGSYYNAYRTFEDQTPFSIYQTRTNETAIGTGGVELGTHIDINKNLYLSMGFAFFSGGEAYHFDDPSSDSTFSYQNKYRQIGIPFRLNVAFGKQYQVFGFGGVVPSSILHQQYVSEYTDINGTVVKNDTELIKTGLASFQFAASLGAGLKYNFSTGSIYAFSEYRPHFSNTLQDVFVVHKMHAVSFGLGLSFSFN